MNCVKCDKPLHKFHDCILNPTANPALAEIQAHAEAIERYISNAGGNRLNALDRLGKIIAICKAE